MEEAWATRFPERGFNALRTFPETPEAWRNDAEAERWARIDQVLAAVTGALELERREKRIGSALEAAPEVLIEDAALLAAFDGVDPAEVFRTSQATLKPGKGDGFRLDPASPVSVRPFRAEGAKCARCWRILPEVADDLCLRCTEAVA
jgi:isoleucyl-tRNA synthetase